jgi:glycosyltransferase involved in cell wall biosynthesis
MFLPFTYVLAGKRAMKLLVLSSVNLGRPGGDTTHFIEKMSHLKKIGLEIFALAPRYSDFPTPQLDFPTKYLPVGKRSFLSFASFQIKIILQSLRLIPSFKPDIVYSRGIYLSFILHPFLKREGIPLIVEQNGLVANERKSAGEPFWLVGLVQYLDMLCSKHCDGIVCVSEGLRNALIKRYKISPEKFFTVENGANDSFFKPLPEEERERLKVKLGFEKEDFVIGFAGSIYKDQALDELVVAASKIPDPRYKFLIIGTGPELDRIITLVKSLNLENRFLFLGKVPYEQVPSLINVFDLGVVLTKKPYLYSTSPIRFFEHLFCGVPLLYTIDVHRDKTFPIPIGVLIHPLNSDNLAQIIVQASKEASEMRKSILQIREVLVEKYSWRSIAQRLKFYLEKTALLGK